ncbi:MAG: divergent polysaccharide deacetylase family protein [Candidatus Omnitrophica bacterium]|nr:divergent polysaccharide deacetylase family protein [Candidatus Omnitrophota bacterium]
MNRATKIFVFILIISAPLIFYKYFYKPRMHPAIKKIIRQEPLKRPKIALIFDDLGENTKDLNEIHSLGIPVTVSIVPGLKFSKSIAQTSKLYGFSVMAHIPLEPKNAQKYQTTKYKFISSSLPRRERAALLRYYLNYIRVAIGVNNHMGSAATEDAKLMKEVMRAVKYNGLFFIDSRTSNNSIACEVAKKEGVVCDYNEGFFDSVDDINAMQNKFFELLKKAKEKGKIIIIAHPKKKTFFLLHKLLPKVSNEIQFITIKDYLGL